MMTNNTKQSFLRLIADQLQPLGWQFVSDWEIELRSEGKLQMAKDIPVQKGESITTTIEVSVDSDDQITFVLGCTIYASISIPGARHTREIEYATEGGVPFMEKHISDEKLILQASQQLSRIVEDHIESEFHDYVANVESEREA